LVVFSALESFKGFLARLLFGVEFCLSAVVEESTLV
jgi:hypothetical protein